MSAVNGQALAALDIISDTAIEINNMITEARGIARDMAEVRANLRELRTIMAEADAMVKSARSTDWMTTTDVSAYLKISPRQVRYLVQQGRLRSYRLDPDAEVSHMRFDRAELEADIKGMA